AAFGGGTVGDVAGFAASAYMRGIRFVQIPTTLEAQVDAAIGGKTGVDLPEGKNLAGAFHQPVVVLCDPAVLRTLPSRQLRAGLAEVVKNGVIFSRPLFEWLERNAARLNAADPRSLARAVLASVRIKAAIVSADERESGRRAILNFGHTAGHALEAAAGYRGLLHGEAVAVGMVCAARLSVRLGCCAPGVVDRLVGLLRRLRLPVRPPRGLDRGRIARALALDKKRVRGVLRVVLTREIGGVTVRAGVSPAMILDILAG
ncbi:MAG: 3-dehydroquinate synthase, partial [bacterium]